MVLSLLAGGLNAFLGGRSADKQARIAERGARQAADTQIAGLRKAGGVFKDYLAQAEAEAREASELEAQGYRDAYDVQEERYGDSLDYLSPYIDRGFEAQSYLDDIIGAGGPEGSASALERYQSSPSAQILRDVMDEAARATTGEFAASGLRGSGAYSQELAKRLSGIALQDYRNYENVLAGHTENLMSRGYGASSRAAGLAGEYGTRLGDRLGQIGRAEAGGPAAAAGYRTRLGDYLGQIEKDVGTVGASGIVGATNARTAGIGAKQNYLTSFLGRMGQAGKKKGTNDLKSYLPSPSTFFLN